MKVFYSKKELARFCEMSATTFRRFLKPRRKNLTDLGCTPCCQLIPRKAAVWLISELGIPENELP